MQSQIVFNLSAFGDTLFLPSAYLVGSDDRLPLGYPVQRATAATIGPHGHALTPALLRLFETIEALTPKQLETRFKPPKAKSVTPLDKLLGDPATKPVVEKYIFEKLDGFLQEIVRDKWPLTLELERKTRASDVRIVFPADELVPHIAFSKTSEGVAYRFQLGSEDEKWPIRTREVKPLTNMDPAWLLVDYALYRVPGINGNMVKPFRTKDVVQIPPDKAKVYFRQFVAKSAGRTRIEAEGFEVHIAKNLQHTKLIATENVLQNTWLLQALFQYEGAAFSHGERRDQVTAVDFATDGSDDIVVRQVQRDKAAEAAQVEVLTRHGALPDGKLFAASADGALEPLIGWLATHQKVLENAGFLLELPQIDGRAICLEQGTIAVRSVATDDWFEVQGQVTVGAFNFPFKALWQHLRRHDRFFRLPDGTFFLIPETWFTRYAELAESSKEGPDDVLRLPKALYTLLQNTGLDGTDTTRPFEAIDPENVAYDPSDQLKATLRPYQLQGVKWLAGHYLSGFGACLADDMGLGKTLQTIALLLFIKSKRSQQPGVPSSAAQLDLFQSYQTELQPLNALIVLPASLVFNWQQELVKFAPSLFVCAHTGAKRGTDARALSGYDVVLTTYHTARQDMELLQKVGWHVLILDESQQIKNRSTEISKVVLRLEAPCKISLSGTPIENSLSDLWTQMEFINPATLGSFSDFKTRFLLPIERYNDAAAKQKLFQRVRPFFLRRTKEEVAPDLPELTEQLFFSEMTAAQQKVYDRVKSAARNEILALFDDPKTRFQALQALTRLRQLANDPRLVEADYSGGSGKFDDVLAQWDTIRRAGHKVLFFSSFEKHLQLFRAALEAKNQAYAWLTGDTAMPDRAKEVAKFQDDPQVQAFFMTVKAGGVGLNLTAADYVFLLDPWWNPAAEDQAIARAHRIGQKRPVTALRFLSRNTVEEKIRALQERKKKLGAALFESDEPTAITREELESLLL